MKAPDVAAIAVVLAVLYHRMCKRNVLMERARAVVVEQVRDRYNMPFV